MKNILIILISLLALSMNAQEIVSRTYTLINQADTAFYIRTRVLMGNGDYTEKQTYVGTDSTQAYASVDQIRIDAVNKYTEVSGIEAQLLQAEGEADAMAKDAGRMLNTLFGKNINQLNGQQFYQQFAGKYRVVDTEASTNNVYELVQLQNGSVRMKLNSDPNVVLNVVLLSPVRFTIKGLNGKDVTVGLKGNTNKGFKLYTDRSLSVRVVQISTPPQPTE